MTTVLAIIVFLLILVDGKRGRDIRTLDNDIQRLTDRVEEIEERLHM